MDFLKYFAASFILVVLLGLLGAGLALEWLG